MSILAKIISNYYYIKSRVVRLYLVFLHKHSYESAFLKYKSNDLILTTDVFLIYYECTDLINIKFKYYIYTKTTLLKC